MPGTRPKSFQCVACGKRTRPKERRFVNTDVYKDFIQHLSIEVAANDIDLKYYIVKHVTYILYVKRIEHILCIRISLHLHDN